MALTPANLRLRLRNRTLRNHRLCRLLERLPRLTIHQSKNDSAHPQRRALRHWHTTRGFAFLIFKVVSLVTPQRVPKDVELAGLDDALHGEAASAPARFVIPNAGALLQERHWSSVHLIPTPVLDR